MGAMAAFEKQCLEWKRQHQWTLECLQQFQANGPASAQYQQQGYASDDSELYDELKGYGANPTKDPYIAESAFEEMQASLPKFQQILQNMYVAYRQAKQDAEQAALHCPDDSQLGWQSVPSDIAQLIQRSLEMYELEYQHVEALLNSMDFKLPGNVLATYIDSFSMQPFLDKDVLAEASQVLGKELGRENEKRPILLLSRYINH